MGVSPIAARGFTLVELLVVIAIMVIFLSMGVPAYQDMIVSNRISTNINGLKADIEYARSEALKQGLPVIVCASTDAINCNAATGTDWSTGWIVFAAANCAATTSAAGTSDSMLRIRDALTSKDTAVYTPNTNGNNSLCFNRLGYTSTAYTGMFNFNSLPAADTHMYCLSFSGVGHTQVLRKGASDISGVNCA